MALIQKNNWKIYSFIKSMLSAYYVPDTGDTARTKQTETSALYGADIQGKMFHNLAKSVM